MTKMKLACVIDLKLVYPIVCLPVTVSQNTLFVQRLGNLPFIKHY